MGLLLSKGFRMSSILNLASNVTQVPENKYLGNLRISFKPCDHSSIGVMKIINTRFFLIGGFK
jgi:hypothetical protein